MLATGMGFVRSASSTTDDLEVEQQQTSSASCSSYASDDTDTEGMMQQVFAETLDRIFDNVAVEDCGGCQQSLPSTPTLAGELRKNGILKEYR